MNTREPSDVVSVLQEQHAEIRRLIAEVKSSTGAARREAFEPLVRLLAVHETSEEEVVYPMLQRSAPEAEGAVDARKQEEDAAKKALADLEGMDAASMGFVSSFAAFAADVDAHASAEEQTIFPLLEATRDAEELERMATALKAAQAFAPTHAHRAAPESAVGNMLVGPFVAMVDRVRDAIRDATRSRA